MTGTMYINLCFFLVMKSLKSDKLKFFQGLAEITANITSSRSKSAL